VLVLAVGVGLALDPGVRALPVRARFSDLGRVGGPGAIVFDAGLLLAGALGCVFARGLWTAASRAGDLPAARVVAAFAGTSYAALAGAGLFPLPALAHTPLLVTGYLAATSTVVADAARRRSAGDTGGTVLLGAIGVVLSLWGLRAVVGLTFLMNSATSALLPPELATVALLVGWTVGRARSLGGD
jgi:hypothetical membrane protein